MTVYHGSTLEIRHPDVGRSKRFLDFGPAFYVTSYRIIAANLKFVESYSLGSGV